MAAGCCLHFLHQVEQWRQTPRPLKSQSQTGAGRLSCMGSQSGLATSGVLSPPAAPGYHRWEAQPWWLLREGSQKRGRVLPTSLSGDRGVGWRKWTKQPASSQTSSRPGLGISQKVKKSSVNTSCPGPAPFLAVKHPSLGLPHRLTHEAIFTLEGCLDQWCIKTGPASCFQTLLRGSLAWVSELPALPGPEPAH